MPGLDLGPENHLDLIVFITRLENWLDNGLQLICHLAAFEVCQDQVTDTSILNDLYLYGQTKSTKRKKK